MTELLTLPTVGLLGLAASGHCMAMCGGITGALAIGTAGRGPRRVSRIGDDAPAEPHRPRQGPRYGLLLATQLGRIGSYTLAGALAGGLAGGVTGLLEHDGVRLALRILAALALLMSAAVIAGWLRDPGRGLGTRLWRHLAPLGRRFLPLDSVPRALAFGAIWGWMPCGFVYSILLVAALSADWAQAAATMAVFGLGTLPAMLATAAGAPMLLGVLRRSGAGPRKLLGIALFACALLTAGVPLLMLDSHAGHAAHGVTASGITVTTSDDEALHDTIGAPRTAPSHRGSHR